MATTLRGTVKRTGNGALVAEVAFGPTTWELKGKDVTVDGVTSRVIDTGARFKRNGYAFVYLYLAEPETPVEAPARRVSEWERSVRAQERQQQIEEAEDRGEFDLRFPGGIEIGHE